jgi:WD repeat-containing protein 68
VQSQSTGPPLTSFSWNEKAPSLVVTSSIDTTCTVWNIDTSTAITQLIAHDREVYDVAWLPGSTDIFVSVGADGSLRAFDLRSLEHSTILYETPAPKSGAPAASASSRLPTSPLLRIAFNPADSNYMSTFHMDGQDVQILDMRSPGQPVIELRGHRAQVNAMGWSTTDRPTLATAGRHYNKLSRARVRPEPYMQGMIVRFYFGTLLPTHKRQPLLAPQILV